MGRGSEERERETNEQHCGTVALVASPKERDDVESHQKNKGVPKHRCGGLAQ